MFTMTCTASDLCSEMVVPPVWGLRLDPLYPHCSILVWRYGRSNQVRLFALRDVLHHAEALLPRLGSSGSESLLSPNGTMSRSAGSAFTGRLISSSPPPDRGASADALQRVLSHLQQHPVIRDLNSDPEESMARAAAAAAAATAGSDLTRAAQARARRYGGGASAGTGLNVLAAAAAADVSSLSAPDTEPSQRYGKCTSGWRECCSDHGAVCASNFTISSFRCLSQT